MVFHIGLSAGHRTAPEAEHWLHESVLPALASASRPAPDEACAIGPASAADRLHRGGQPAQLVACTHLVRAPFPHVAVSLAVRELDGSVRLTGLPTVAPELTEAAAHAADEHAAQRSGRAVLFPGVERLVGTITVGDLLATSAIERITVLGGDPDPPPDTLIDTRDFVRPQWLDAKLTLVTAPAGPGRLAPFEVPNPTPCCADHS
jgi:hypothetical protein